MDSENLFSAALLDVIVKSSDLVCCMATLVKWLCQQLPANANPLIRNLICSLAAFLEAICAILIPGTAGG